MGLVTVPMTLTSAWSRRVRKRGLQSGTVSVPGRCTGARGDAARIPSTSPFRMPREPDALAAPRGAELVAAGIPAGAAGTKQGKA